MTQLRLNLSTARLTVQTSSNLATLTPILIVIPIIAIINPRLSYRMVRKVLELEMNGDNVIKVMNTWVIAAVHYTAGILGCIVNELQDMDRKRRLMTIKLSIRRQTVC